MWILLSEVLMLSSKSVSSQYFCVVSDLTGTIVIVENCIEEEEIMVNDMVERDGNVWRRG
jgi:hypothetical protein